MSQLWITSTSNHHVVEELQIYEQRGSPSMHLQQKAFLLNKISFIFYSIRPSMVVMWPDQCSIFDLVQLTMGNRWLAEQRIQSYLKLPSKIIGSSLFIVSFLENERVVERLHCQPCNGRVRAIFTRSFYLPDSPTVALDFGASLDPTNIADGNDVYFECKISANPDVYKVVWLHNVSPYSFFTRTTGRLLRKNVFLFSHIGCHGFEWQKQRDHHIRLQLGVTGCFT